MPLFSRTKTRMPSADEALPGREQPMRVPARHEVLGTPLQPPFPDGLEQMVVGMGCFWGAEKIFWQAPGVFTTARRAPATTRWCWWSSTPPSPAMRRC